MIKRIHKGCGEKAEKQPAEGLDTARVLLTEARKRVEGAKKKVATKEEGVGSQEQTGRTPTAPIETPPKPKLYPSLLDQAWRENPDDEVVVVRRRQPPPVPLPPPPYAGPQGAEGGREEEPQRGEQDLATLLRKWIEVEKGRKSRKVDRGRKKGRECVHGLHDLEPSVDSIPITRVWIETVKRKGEIDALTVTNRVILQEIVRRRVNTAVK